MSWILKLESMVRKETQPVPFGDYDDANGWNGLSVSAHYLTDCLFYEYQRQQEAIQRLLQGTFGQAFRSDHTRKVVRKVTFTSGTMSSYAIMNENWMVLLWVMVQSETQKSLEPMYQGLANRYSNAKVEKAQYQWVDRDCCAALRVPDPKETEHLNWDAWRTVDAVIAEASSDELLNKRGTVNFQRLVDLKVPGVRLPGVFDPFLIADLNAVSAKVLGTPKYPAFQVSAKDSGERFGLEYVEPGCRPVVLDWEKHKSKTTEDFNPAEQRSTHTSQSADQQSPECKTESQLVPSLTSFCGTHLELQSESESTGTPPAPLISLSHRASAEPWPAPETTYTPPLPMLASPTSTHTGPVKTGGRVFVLDHKRWTKPMKEAIDNLLETHHGKKDMLKLVDHDYSAMVHNSCNHPNSMLHPTTRLHIAQYVKRLAKLLNTNTSLNTSPEKLLERQQLWHSLTEGSETTRVPVVEMHPTALRPPAPALTTTLTPESLGQIVEGIMEKQQQQQQPEQKRKQTKTCLACRQPKSRYENDGSAVHFFISKALSDTFTVQKRSLQQ
ncbi:hypothetical protein Baya_4307 [Bagarius yarrelli]|uniref:Uncharacterized protein n=1 Tax=Bagarius yarrelli TaxID=175774 RepID=A0A556TW01_BAGYA|nr:hypothetical protein Baya_4307 [Bagarius yarrelli]